MPADPQRGAHGVLGRRALSARRLLLTAALLVRPVLLGAQAVPLPPPLPVPRGDEGVAAGLLAADVLAGGQRGLAALLAALRASGIAVRDPGGRVLVTPAQPAQGISFDSWEVRSMASLGVVGTEHRLAEVAQLFATRLPKLDQARVEELMQMDLVATSSQPTLRFWRHFLVALNPAWVVGNAANTDTTFTLSALQMALVLRRLTGDLLAVGQRPRGGGGPDGSTEWLREGGPDDGAPAGPNVAALDGFVPRSLKSPLAVAPCTITQPQEAIQDVVATGLTTGFSKLMDDLADLAAGAGGVAEKIGTYTGLANVVFAYSKLIMAMAGLKAEFKVEPPGAPLVRTKTSQAGQIRYVLGTLRVDVGNLEAVNCARGVLALVGLDFTTPKNGPLAGVEVSWSFLDGPSAEELPYWIVRWAPGSRPDRGTSDAKGTARIGVEGSPQRAVLDESYLVPDTTSVTLLLLTTLKPRDLFGDLREAASGALGGVGLLVTLPAEMISRTRWFGGRYRLPVVDWKYAFRMTLAGGGDDSICPESDGWDMREEYEGVVRVGDYPDSASGKTYDGGGEVRWSVQGLVCAGMPNPDGPDPPTVLCTMKVDAGGIGKFYITLTMDSDEPQIDYRFRPDGERSHVTVTGTCPDSEKELVRQSVGIAHGSFPISAAVRGPYSLPAGQVDHRASGGDFVVRLSPPPREQKP